MLLKKPLAGWLFSLDILLLLACANAYPFLEGRLWVLWPVAILTAVGNLLPLVCIPLPKGRMRVLCHGVRCLCLFCVTVTGSGLFHIGLAVAAWMTGRWRMLLFSALLCVAVEAVLFWNGMICVYLTSGQLGIKWRVIGALCGFVPVANLILLGIIISRCSKECRLEEKRYRTDLARKSQQICDTKYPILMVHGVFFRDTAFFNYWGRIPEALKQNGARIYYGNQPSAAAVSDCAKVLARRIREICAETGCEKVNIIAHSKGGLDCRYALCHEDVAEMVASLTTVNTPHRGCLFADYLLNKLPEGLKEQVANTYNTALKAFGEADADFIAAVSDLTATRCQELFEDVPTPEGVYCRSIGSRLKGAASGQFPLNFSYHLAKHFDGPNDGLVGEGAFPFGEHFTLLEAPGKRGISHGDMIDLNREDIPGFDVRELYVQLVAGLKNKGL